MDHVATGFFVNVQSKVVPDIWFPYFVTAKHVAAGLRQKKYKVVVNTKDGGVTTLRRLPIWSPHL